MSYTKPRPDNIHFEFIRAVSGLLSKSGGPLSQTLHSFILGENYRALIDFKIDYTDKTFSAGDFENARQILALVEKQDYLDVGYDRKASALRSFYEAEEKCRETNIRLSSSCPEKDVSAVLHYASRKIADVLSDVPSYDRLDFFFGPGATTNVNGFDACYKSKLSARMSCSDEMLPFVGEFLEEFPLWTEANSVSKRGDILTVPVDVSYGKVSFVPKNSKTYRSISIEPILNGLCQKGIGSYISNRLRRFGVNLTDQTRNQHLARIGSESNRLATIDLSMASDTVSLGLVFNLLPFPWSDFLSRYRTGHVECEGKILELEKFSSMGNGYTFELESLIFYGLLMGVHSYLDQIGEASVDFGSSWSVYGDDIILPSSYYSMMSKVLTYCGFSINHSKSFHDGPFRESCGNDYFLGSEIRPFYLRKKISDQVLYSFHNWAARNFKFELCALILKYTNSSLRLFGPNGFGDGHLIGSYSLIRSRKLRRLGYEGGYFRTYKLKPRRNLKTYRNDFLLPSYTASCGASKEGPYDSTIARGSRGYTKIFVYTMARGIFIP